MSNPKLEYSWISSVQKWSCIDGNTYDGAPDSSNRNMIGYGATKEQAAADWRELYEISMEELSEDDINIGNADMQERKERP